MVNWHDITGILVAIGFTCFCLWLVIQQTKTLIANDKILFLFIFLVTIIASAWMIDNVIMPHVALLDEDENKFIIQNISYIISTIMGYYLRGKVDENKNNLK